MNHPADVRPARSLALVGGGVRANYFLQALVLALRGGAEPWFHRIMIFNAVGAFGTGWVHDPELPEYALLNRSAEGLSLGPTTGQPAGVSLHAWLGESKRWSRSRSWASRAEYGNAMREIFVRTCDELRDDHGIEVLLIRETVTDVRLGDAPAPFLLRTDPGGRHRARVAILLVGHESGNRHLVSGPPSVRAPYPMAHAAPGTRIAIDGTGLTAIELALHLTEGQGGRFARSGADGQLTYEPSGSEPASIAMVSASGLLPLPRPLDADRPLPFYEPVFLRPDQGLIDSSAASIWNAILSELAVAYATQARRHAGAGPLPDLHELALFRAYVLRETTGLDTRELLGRATRMAALGLSGDALCAALEIVFRRLRPNIQALVDRRALPVAEDWLIRERYFTIITKCVNGPSLESLLRIEALIDAGIVTVEKARPDTPAVYDGVLPGRVPSIAEVGEHGTLTSRLLRRGLLSNGANEGYAGVAVDDAFRAVDVAGDAVPGLYVLGAPLEGYKSFQFSAARPDVTHEVLREIGTLCDAVLGEPAPAPAPSPVPASMTAQYAPRSRDRRGVFQ